MINENDVSAVSQQLCAEDVERKNTLFRRIGYGFPVACEVLFYMGVIDVKEKFDVVAIYFLLLGPIAILIRPFLFAMERDFEKYIPGSDEEDIAGDIDVLKTLNNPSAWNLYRSIIRLRRFLTMVFYASCSAFVIYSFYVYF